MEMQHISNVNKPIEVIAHFTQKGEINPLRFRIEGEDGQQVIKIERITNRSKNQVLCKFECVIKINDRETICELCYYISELRWLLI